MRGLNAEERRLLTECASEWAIGPALTCAEIAVLECLETRGLVERSAGVDGRDWWGETELGLLLLRVTAEAA